MTGTKKKKQAGFEIRGVKSIQISQAIQFLDMIQQGYADFGKIKSERKPAEFSDSGTMAFWSTMIVLEKFDPGMRKAFFESFREKMGPEIPARTIWFIRITLFGSFLGMAILFLLEVMRQLGIVPTQIAFPVLIAGFVVVLVLVSLITIYAFKNEGKEPPPGVLAALSEPQIRFDAERAFERIVGIFQEVSNQPLRVIVIGDYDAFEYTGETYTTSRKLELKLAILSPISRYP
ncbi:MAG: hypothetical protein ACFFEF_06480 [Candidatus Thorarchaeota archaeon]